MPRPLAVAVLGLSLPLLTGCPSQTTVAGFLDQILANAFPEFLDIALTIRVINNSGYDSELDLLVDDVPQTIECSDLERVCDVYLSECPTTIQALEKRLMDTSGGFVGAQYFTNNAEAFTFEEGEFQCGSALIFQLGFDETEAFPL